MIMELIDDFLNGITMYRLVLYVLIILVIVATALSFAKLLPFKPVALPFSAAFLTIICWVTNKVFARVFKVPTNLESVYITALILALIMTPASGISELLSLFWVAVLAQASKYILSIKQTHIFNPAAFAVALTSITLNYSASWWVGTFWMAPFVTAGGLLIVRKIKRFDMVSGFFIAALAVILGSSVLKGNNLFLTIQKIILETPILFFAFVMLTEPLTAPSRKIWQIIYGSLAGGLFYFTPETALLAGNIFSYIVSPKEKLLLQLKEKIQIAPEIYDFVFGLSGKLNFLPGQFMEWTLSHKNPDSRGNRRYFTIASSPTEDNLRIGVKFYQNSSSFKKSLIASETGREIIASRLAGDFTLPKDQNKKLMFIAGGIGVTPYRSIIKYLLDTNERRDIILFYSAKSESDFVYKDIFNMAYEKLNIKTVYVTGRIDSDLISAKVPDFISRIFYISGPHSMVDAYDETLKEMGISGKQIKVDFFPGYA